MLLQAVETLCREMRTLLLEAGITLEQFEQVLIYCQQASHPDVRDVLQMLQEFRKEPYENLLRIWERHSRERWENIKYLEDLEGRKLHESTVLDRRRTEVRKTWREILRVAKIETAK